jgi:hypothetical protein
MAWSAPSARQAAHFSSLPAVTMTCEPSALANWMAVTPMPLDPPCTSSVSPGCRRAMEKTFCQTVKKVSGKLADCTMFSPSGTGRHWPAGATQRSA